MEFTLDNIFEAMDRAPGAVYVEALSGLVLVNHNTLFNSLCNRAARFGDDLVFTLDKVTKHEASSYNVCSYGVVIRCTPSEEN